MDNLTGGREATEHLIGLGHSRIGFIAHDDESPELVDRHRGYDAAMHGHGLAEERFVRKCFMSIEAGREAALELLTRHPDITAIFAASDVAALGTIQAALELGRRIPEELAIIGFDDPGNRRQTDDLSAEHDGPAQGADRAAGGQDDAGYLRRETGAVPVAECSAGNQENDTGGKIIKELRDETKMVSSAVSAAFAGGGGF